MSGAAMLVTTVDSDDKARMIISAALEARLAACAQLFPIRSHYVWKGALEEQQEILVQMKIRSEDHDALAALVRRLHPYETPEILKIDIAAVDPDYFAWLTDATAR